MSPKSIDSKSPLWTRPGLRKTVSFLGLGRTGFQYVPELTSSGVRTLNRIFYMSSEPRTEYGVQKSENGGKHNGGLGNPRLGSPLL